MPDPYASFESLKAQREAGMKDYPGKLPPVNRKKKAEKSVEDELEWDSSPVVYIYGGEAREFFTIGHLATALGRAAVTIRSWEANGKLPKSPYRSPAPKKSAIQSKPKGKRLWTRAQIEGLLDIAGRTGCITDDKQSPPNKQFTEQATQLFIHLLNQEKADNK